MIGHSPNSNDTSSKLVQVVAAASFIVITCFAIVVLFLAFPNMSLVLGIPASALCGMVISTILGRYVAKREEQLNNQAESEIRVIRETEKQRQIDEMRAKNSNVPKVKRQMYAAKK